MVYVPLFLPKKVLAMPMAMANFPNGRLLNDFRQFNSGLRVV